MISGQESCETEGAQRLFEAGETSLPMRERLRRAVERMRSGEPRISLREMQKSVVQDAIEYLEGVVEQDDDSSPFARIILPPRSGKTVVAASLMSRSELVSVFLVPKRVIAEQAVAEFREFLPGVPVGVYTGESKELPKGGIIVTTYQKLWSDLKSGTVPEPIKCAAFVFADEAHRSMTKKRQQSLAECFDPLAVRIALTATPDFNEERTLSTYFPDLIHEITIQEGVGLRLLSPVRAFVGEVDIDASSVRVGSGEYEQEALGLIMSKMPMLDAVRFIRYDGENRELPALIACTTRAQAWKVFEYFAAHRPEGTPCPAPILGDTDPEMRRKFLAYFEEGRLDTLITVGVLIEGWDAPKCKLLIDLAPSLSWVRSAQKYARVMTPHKGQSARIYVLTPAGLRQSPVLPMDVFGPGLQAEAEDDWNFPAKPARGSGVRRKDAWQRMADAGIPVKSVQASLRVLEEYRIDRLKLDPSKIRSMQRLILRALRTQPSADTRGFAEFSARYFRIRGVTIRGSQLLRTLGFQATHGGYKAFLAKYFPDVYSEAMLYGSAGWYLRRKRYVLSEDFSTVPLEEMEESCAERFRREFYSPPRNGSQSAAAVDGLAAVSGHRPEAPDEAYDRQVLERFVVRDVESLSSKQANVLRYHFGLRGTEEMTLRDIGELLEFSSARAWQYKVEALRELRSRPVFYHFLDRDPGDFRGYLGWIHQSELEREYTAHRGWRASLLVGAWRVANQCRYETPPLHAPLSALAALEKAGVTLHTHPSHSSPKWLIWRRQDRIRASPFFRALSSASFYDGILSVKVFLGYEDGDERLPLNKIFNLRV